MTNVHLATDDRCFSFLAKERRSRSDEMGFGGVAAFVRSVLSDWDSQGVWGMEEAPIKPIAKRHTPVAGALFERSELHTIAEHLTPWLEAVAKRPAVGLFNIIALWDGFGFVLWD